MLKNIFETIISILVILIGIGGVIAYIINNKNDEEKIKILNEKVETLNKEILRNKIERDSIIKVYNNTIDSITNIKNKTIIIYEQAEKDFSNNRIISDDSILLYIASKIQD